MLGVVIKTIRLCVYSKVNKVDNEKHKRGLSRYKRDARSVMQIMRRMLRMIVIGICDDNLSLQKKYAAMIKSVMNKIKHEHEIIIFHDGKDVLTYVKQEHKNLDILFLDILMKDLNGVETAKSLKELNIHILINFLTSSEEYIFDALRLKPYAYLMKDQLSVENLEEILHQNIDIIEKRKKEKWRLREIDSSFDFSLDDISYIKVCDTHCTIYQYNGLFIELDNLKILDFIKEIRFFKVSHTFIIGLRFVQKIEKKRVVLSDCTKSEIPIEEGKVKRLKLAFTQFMMKQM